MKHLLPLLALLILSCTSEPTKQEVYEVAKKAVIAELNNPSSAYFSPDYENEIFDLTTHYGIVSWFTEEVNGVTEKHSFSCDVTYDANGNTTVSEMRIYLKQ